MWNIYKPQVANLPEETGDEVAGLYYDLILANAIVDQDLHKVAWGRGYLDKSYQDICNRIKDKAPEVLSLLEETLRES